MTTPPVTSLYKRHRFPAEIISHGVWLYVRFCLSGRDVEGLMAARGVILTYEAVRYRCQKFGQAYAHELRRQRPRPGDTWHLDEVSRTTNGERHDLWRPSIKTGTCWISWSNAIAIRPLRRRSAVCCSKGVGTSHE